MCHGLTEFHRLKGIRPWYRRSIGLQPPAWRLVRSASLRRVHGSYLADWLRMAPALVRDALKTATWLEVPADRGFSCSRPSGLDRAPGLSMAMFELGSRRRTFSDREAAVATPYARRTSSTAATLRPCGPRRGSIRNSVYLTWPMRFSDTVRRRSARRTLWPADCGPQPIPGRRGRPSRSCGWPGRSASWQPPRSGMSPWFSAFSSAPCSVIPRRWWCR